jgi:hypothetical protein
MGEFVGMSVEKFVFVGMAHGELEIAFASFLGTRAGLKGFDDILLNPSQQSAQDVLAITEAAINGGRVCSRSLGHGSHGESLIRALFPQLLGGIQNTFLQMRIRLPRHFCPFQSTKTI